VLVVEKIPFGRSHDLAYLLGLLPAGKTIPPTLMALPLLNKYAVQYRYPGEAPTLNAHQRKQAVRLAEDAVAWATRMTT